MSEQTLSSTVAYSARPTIRVDELDNARLNTLMQSVEITEQEGGMSSLEMRLENVSLPGDDTQDFAFEDADIVTLGTLIAVYSGDEFQPREIFKGMVTGLEIVLEEGGMPELVVLAEDPLQMARKLRRTRVYEDPTISELVETVASELNLTPVVTGLTDTITTQVQLNESDLAFLRRVLARYDADLQVVGSELQASPRQDVERGTVTLEATSQLRSSRIMVDMANQVTEVRIGGWDDLNGQAVEGIASGQPQGPGQGTPGAHFVQQAFGDVVHGVSHLAVTTQSEADAVAQAIYEHRSRNFVRVIATAEGNALIRVGTYVELLGFGPRFNNVYYITNAVHRWDTDTGYETDFEAVSAYWNGQ